MSFLVKQKKNVNRTLTKRNLDKTKSPTSKFTSESIMFIFLFLFFFYGYINNSV